MLVDSIIPWAGIIGVLLAPSVIGIWAERNRAKDAAEVARLAAVAVMKVAEVKSTLADASEQTKKELAQIASIGEATHTIVNSQRTEMKAEMDVMRATISDLVLRLDRAERR
jgi:hypothetical protein